LRYFTAALLRALRSERGAFFFSFFLRIRGFGHFGPAYFAPSRFR